MPLATYRIVLLTLYAVGFLTAAAYLVLYRAWEWRRWRSPAVRDVSGIILVLWAIYGWLIYRLIDATMAGRANMPAGPNLWISLAIFVVIDGYFLQRLWHYWQFIREERRHPTVPCPRCAGQGIIPALQDR